jgi:hypothetical protein
MQKSSWGILGGFVLDDTGIDILGGDTANGLDVFGCGAEGFSGSHDRALGGLVGCVGSALRVEGSGGLLVWTDRGGWRRDTF